MKIQINTWYITELGYSALVCYKQPEDVQDPYPYVGFVEVVGDHDDSYKAGVAWSEDGLCGTEMFHTIVREL